MVTIHDKFSAKLKEKEKEKSNRKTNMPATASVVKNNALLNYFNYHIRYLNANSSYTGFYGIWEFLSSNFFNPNSFLV
jgi:hypothetical protein